MQAPRHMPLIVLVLVAAGAAGFGVYQWLAPGSSQPLNSGATVASAPRPGDVPMTVDEALNTKFDSLSDSSSHTLTDWHGKALIVNFWATWCAPCREEIPLLVKLQATYAAQGLQVIGIATDETDIKTVKDYLGKAVVNYPMLMGDESVGRMVAGFGGNLVGLPYTLVLDRNGKVLKLHAGQLDANEAQQLVQMALQLPTGVSPAPAPSAATTSSAKLGTAAK